LHFEIRKKSGYGNDVDPKGYIMWFVEFWEIYMI
jgi:hypothetical protein